MLDAFTQDGTGYQFDQAMDTMGPMLEMATTLLHDAQLGSNKQLAISEAEANLQKAKNALRDAPSRLEQAERAYLALAGWSRPGSDKREYGDQAYADLLFARETDSIKSEQKQEMENAKRRIKNISAVLDGCESSQLYAENAESMLQGLSRENSILENREKRLKREGDVAQRRFWYESHATENARWWLKAAKIVYYFVLVVVLVASPVHRGNWYRSPLAWVRILVLLIAPYFVEGLVGRARSAYARLYYAIHPHLPKDTYLLD